MKLLLPALREEGRKSTIDRLEEDTEEKKAFMEKGRRLE